MSDNKRKLDKTEDRYHGIGDRYHGIDQVLYNSSDLVEANLKKQYNPSDSTQKHEPDLFSSGHESIKRDNAKN